MGEVFVRQFYQHPRCETDMKRCALAAVLLALTGCGTVQNLQRDLPTGATVYGGVDIATARFAPGSQNDGFGLALLWPVYAADVAASAVGDTLALPLTVWAEVIRSINAFYFPPDKPPSNAWRQFWFDDQESVAGEKPPAVLRRE